MKTIRVLQINAGSRNFGGVSAMLLNLYRNIDRDHIQFDFLTPNKTTYGMYREEMENMGAHIYELSINSSSLKGKLKLYKALKVFLRQHTYDIIHVNSGVLLFNLVVAKACKKYSKSKIVVHSHNNGGRSSAKERFSDPLKKKMGKYGDLYLACSDSAAEYMFSPEIQKKTVIIKNGIDVKKFAFSAEVREAVRKELNLQDSFVVGNIGRFNPQKNHAFILQVFEELSKKCEKAKLLLVGQGELEEKMKAVVSEKGLEDKVLFLGQQPEVGRFYQGMDVFFLPSVFEGFGIVNLEAQSAGLPLVVSDAVPKDVDVTEHVVHLSLESDPALFLEALLKAKEIERRDRSESVIEAGYDIKTSTKQLEALYQQILN